MWVGAATEESTLEQVEKGEYGATVTIAHESYPWAVIDQIGRVSVGMDPLQKENANLGMALYTTKSIPKGTRSWDPANYQDQYKKLWLVS